MESSWTGVSGGVSRASSEVYCPKCPRPKCPRRSVLIRNVLSEVYSHRCKSRTSSRAVDDGVRRLAERGGDGTPAFLYPMSLIYLPSHNFSHMYIPYMYLHMCILQGEPSHGLWKGDDITISLGLLMYALRLPHISIDFFQYRHVLHF